MATLLVINLWAFHATSLTLTETSMLERHKQWMTQHGRVYKDNAEKEMRFKIFKDNVEFIESFNREGKKPYRLAVNHLADMSTAQFRASMIGLKPSSHTNPSMSTAFKYENVSSVPDIMDWRKEGAVTPVKNQRICDSCWAFTTIAATEGVTKIKTGMLVSLSEQELIDCDTNNLGCKGGWVDRGFEFTVKNNGIAEEKTYPYEARDNTCKTKYETPVAAKITGYEKVPANSEAALLKAVANQPVSVSIDAGDKSFRHYSSGVYTGKCRTKLGHGVTVVGYGVSNGTKYWLVKNSWGKGWGEEGYVRIQRDIDAATGLCGIAMDASYPTT